MNDPNQSIRQHLRDFEFQLLFIEDLGWDNYDQPVPIEVEEHEIVLQGIAQKRGLAVLFCPPIDDRIPEYTLRKKIDGRMVMQGHQYTTGRRIDLAVDIATMHHCRQPITVDNPGSGRKALYVTSQNTMWVEGLDRAESEALLTTMFDIAEDPSIIYEHVWRKGDLVMWDNLACLHARTDWPPEQRRTLRRCTTEGEPLY